MSEKENSGNGVYIISNEADIPTHASIISYTGDALELNEKNRKEMIVLDLSSGERKIVWILSIKQAYNTNNFLQVVKKAEDAGYKINKKGLIDINLLGQLYEKRSISDNQRAASSDSAAIATFEVILELAMQKGISDIHIENRPNGATIRMRKNGELMEYNPDEKMTFKEANDLCSVIYNVLASTKSITFDPRYCQQATVTYTIKDQDLKLRYQSFPAFPDGYDVVLRVLPIGRSEDFTPLQKRGYTEQQVEDLLAIASKPFGALIIAGVTGSGKSTTLKDLLMYVNADTGYRLKIVSIEDPPEYSIAKITQIPVIADEKDAEKGINPFAKPIKACMRGDPDIIMIGEVRDDVTGDLTKKAIQSGHQVLTTTHTTSALGIIDRFLDFGLTRSVLGAPDFLNGLVYQKLLARVCPHCSIKFEDHINSEHATKKDLDLYKRISSFVDPKKYPLTLRGAGCKECDYQGIKGRTVAAEVVYVDLEMIDHIMHGRTIELIKYWRGLSDGNYASENMRGKTCMEHAFQKMLKGEVCPREVESSFKSISEMGVKFKDEEENESQVNKQTNKNKETSNKKNEAEWDEL